MKKFSDYLGDIIETHITNDQKKEFESLETKYPFRFPYVEKGLTDGKVQVPVYAIDRKLPDTDKMMSESLFDFYVKYLQQAIASYYPNLPPEPYRSHTL